MQRYALYTVMGILLYFVFFQQLDSFHVRTWDESTYAVNSYEMWKNGNYLTPYMKGVPDFEWNTKPPLLLWLQLIFYNLIGYNELAIRLPSALAGVITALYLFLFTAKRFKLLLACSVFLTFITSQLVSDFHASRTGDLDALLLLFLALTLGTYYDWLEQGTPAFIFKTAIWLTLAYLTKSTAAFLFFPALFLLTIIYRKLKELFVARAFYEGAALLLVTVITYVALRQNEGPYIEGLFSNEFNRVYELKAHVQPGDYYLNALFEGNFFWMWPALAGMALSFKNPLTQKMALFLAICLTVHFLIISYASIKYVWYMLPDVLILSWFAGYAVYEIVLRLTDGKKLRQQLLVLLLLLILPYYFASRQSYKSEIPEKQRKDEAIVNYVFKHKKDYKLHRHHFVTTHFNLPLFSYKYMFNERGMDFQIHNDVKNLPLRSMVVICEPELDEQLRGSYCLYEVEKEGDVKRYYILSRKEHASI
jgi:4-amino-4-deoxy-L-arabinose transferase-like glycosyltransferase